MPPCAGQYWVAAQIFDHFQSCTLRDGCYTHLRLLENLHKYPAQTNQHNRPKLGILPPAQDQLAASANHRLYQNTIQFRNRICLMDALHHFLKSLCHRRPVAQVQLHPAHIRLVRNLFGHDFYRHRIADLLSRRLRFLDRHSDHAGHRWNPIMLQYLERLRDQQVALFSFRL